MYMCMHNRKVKGAAGLARLVKHINRLGLYDELGQVMPGVELPDWVSNPDMARQNTGERLTDKEVLKKRADRIEQARLKRKPQKNAAVAIETVFSASPDWFKGKDKATVKAYFDDCKAWATHHFGSENILQAVVHYDEKTPHMHMLMVPITRNVEIRDGVHKAFTCPDGDLRYSSSLFLGGKQNLRMLHTDLAESVGKKYGLKRGIEGSRARHTDQRTWLLGQVKAEQEKVQAETARLDAIRREFGGNGATFADMTAGIPPERLNELRKAFLDKVGQILTEEKQKALTATKTNAEKPTQKRQSSGRRR